MRIPCTLAALALLSAAATQAQTPYERPPQEGLTNFTESPVKASISGRLHFPGGQKPDVPMQVRLQTHTGMVLDQAVVSNSGNFQFNHANCGFYVLAVDVAGYQPVRMPLEHSFIPAEGLILTMIPAEAGAAAIPPAAWKEYERGAQSFHRKDLKRSVAHFQNAIQMCPAFDDAYADLALVQMQQKNLAAAQKTLEAAVERGTKSARVHALLGRVYRLQSQFARAIAPLEKAVELKESSWMARMELAEALVALQRYEEAGPHAARAHELNPGLPAIHQLHYNTLVRRNQLRAALDELEDFLRLFPEHSLAKRAREQQAALTRALSEQAAVPTGKNQ